jgi:hypothetical protein
MSRIETTLMHWFPEAFSDTIFKTGTDYEILNSFSSFTMDLIENKDPRAKKSFKVISLLYSRGTRYERNAIENEFFFRLYQTETAELLKQHLDLMPEELKSIYLKIILED